MSLCMWCTYSGLYNLCDKNARSWALRHAQGRPGPAAAHEFRPGPLKHTLQRQLDVYVFTNLQLKRAISLRYRGESARAKGFWL